MLRARSLLSGRRFPLRSFATSVWNAASRDDVTFYAAGIAFHSLFSIFSLLFLLSILVGLVGGDPEKLLSLAAFARGLLPEKAEEFLGTVMKIVSRPVPKELLPVAILTTLWTASNVVQAMIHALNRIYHLADEVRKAWRTRLLALGLVGSSAVLLLLGFVLMVFGNDLSGGFLEVERLRTRIVAWALVARVPLSILVVFLGSLSLYWLAPNFKQEHRISWPGALVFTVSWTVTTLGFNIYLREIAVYDKVYGPMATVVVVLVWVYLSALLCLVGGEFNAAIHRMRAAGERL